MHFKASLSYVKMEYSLAKAGRQGNEIGRQMSESMLEDFLSPSFKCKEEVLLKEWDFVPYDCADERWKLAKMWPELFKDFASLDDHFLDDFVDAQKEYVAARPERAEEVAIEG